MTAVLVFDVSAARGGVGFCSPRKSGYRELPVQRKHAETLVPMVLEVMKECHACWEDLDGIGVSTGPGSFTGIRVGLAAAQGFSAARDVALSGVGSLDILARACYDVCHPLNRERVYALRDVRRGEVAIQSFSVTQCGLNRASEMEIMQVADLQVRLSSAEGADKTWISGDSKCFPTSQLPELNRFEPTGIECAGALANLTQQALATGVLKPAVPVYARPANATPPRARH